MGTAIHEPAILYCIFRELEQQDLLSIQRVCRSWRTIITTDKRLLSQLWLHPALPVENVGQDETSWDYYRRTSFNPLLMKHFPRFFDMTIVPDYSPHHGKDNLGPWTKSGLLNEKRDVNSPVKHTPRLASYLYPEASWRNMIPCREEVKEFQLDLKQRGGTHGVFRTLQFRNEGSWKYGSDSPPWLTFGMIYDVVENAWFHGRPQIVAWVHFDYTFLSVDAYYPAYHGPLWEDVAENQGFPAADRIALTKVLKPKIISGPGQLLVSLLCYPTNAEERAAEREEAQKYRRKLKRRRKPWLEEPYEPFKSTIFTNKFHVEGGKSVNDIQ